MGLEAFLFLVFKIDFCGCFPRSFFFDECGPPRLLDRVRFKSSVFFSSSTTLDLARRFRRLPRVDMIFVVKSYKKINNKSVFSFASSSSKENQNNCSRSLSLVFKTSSSSSLLFLLLLFYARACITLPC